LRAARVLGTGQALTADTLFTTAHAFLAQTSSALAVAQLDDIADESDPVNVPTTSDQYPNWRRRTGLTVEDLADDPRVTAWFALAGAAGRLRTPLGAARYPSGSASDAQA
jgi:4-alpha-glucanotransferase